MLTQIPPAVTALNKKLCEIHIRDVVYATIIKRNVTNSKFISLKSDLQEKITSFLILINILQITFY
jgi:hypothetical protein